MASNDTLSILKRQTALEDEQAFLSYAYCDFLARIEFDIRLIAHEDKDKAIACRRALRWVKSNLGPLVSDRTRVLEEQVIELAYTEAC